MHLLKCKSGLHPTRLKRQKQISKEIGIGFGVVVTGIAMIFTPLAYAIVSGLVSGTGASMLVTAGATWCSRYE
jgi:hypothetical protein